MNFSPKDLIKFFGEDNWPLLLLSGGVSTAAACYYYMGHNCLKASETPPPTPGKGRKIKKSGAYTPYIYRPVRLPDQHSIILPGDERIRISCLCSNGKATSRWMPDLPKQTMYEVFMRGLRINPNNPALGFRKRSNPGFSGDHEPDWEPEYSWYTFEEVRSQAHTAGSGIVSLGLPPASGAKVGIYSPNRVEWDITQLACTMFNYIVVPLYDSQSLECQTYIINQTELSIIFCDNQSRVDRLLENKDSLPNLKTLVIYDAWSIKPDLWGRVQAAGWKLLTFAQILAFGDTNLQPICPAEPDDIFIIMYTSGTTGVPKGVVMLHKTVVTDVESIFRLYSGYMKDDRYLPNEDDCYISYLPNAHGFNQVCTAMMLTMGSKVGYYRGDVKLLLEDAQLLKPTFFPMVPRLMNRLYAGVMAKVQGSKVKQLLMQKGLAAKRKEVMAGLYRRNSLFDKLVFGKVQAMLGGRVRSMVTGAAPVSDDVMLFVRCAMGVPVFEGYGQTETTAASTLTLPGSNSLGNVGAPLPCCEIKLIDVPEMNYFAKEDKGEVCFRGQHCFVGYYKDEEKTREVLDEEGWVHSGDIGAWTKEGTLKIIDRKKHIFKLAQGEYVAPEKVEGVYAQNTIVAQIYVHGDSLQTCCVGICVPEEAVLRQIAAEEGVNIGANETFAQLCARPDIKALVLSQLTKWGKMKKLNSLEIIKAVYLSDELFSTENGLLTPTFKTKRPEVRKRFQKEIDSMYATLSSEAPAQNSSSNQNQAKL